MASHPIWHMFLFISSIICVVTASIFAVVTDQSSLSTGVLDHYHWLLLLLLLPLLAFFLREKRSSSSSLTSFVVPERKYEVFLSFRGRDIRDGFLSHLLVALDQKKVDYFVDDQNLEEGSEISPALMTAIEQSEICLVIFSKNYASSAWCLEELAHIIECMKNHNQIVIPVFYKVDPSSVRHQKESYRDAFAGHKKRFGKYKVQKWRDALKKAADLSGLHSSNCKTDADLITKIVQCVLQKLNITSHHDDLKGLFGIQGVVTRLETLLRKKSQNVFIIGIWGPGGIGKTTIAEVLFKRLWNEYEGRCFLRARGGLDKHGQLKEKLLSMLLGEDPDIVINSGILPIYKRLQRKKVLVVLDDINILMQLEMLVGRREWLGSDSRIIVTSRNKDTIKICDFIYEVNQLNSKGALQLFNLNALPESFLDKEHEMYELSKRVIEYTQGNPLAIKVLGSLLKGKNKIEWESKLNKLDKILDPNIQDVLELSYNDLDDEQKDIFLYLACFFGRDSKERIISLLDDDDYHIIDGLSVLQDRALIILGGRTVSMHNLIQKMGREIVRKKYPKNPDQRNHLWHFNDICEVLENNKGTGEIESVSLHLSTLKRDLHLRPQAFVRMDNLKLLRFETDYPRCYTRIDNKFKVHVPEEGIILPNKIRYLRWDFYPLESLPLGFCVDNLVELHFPKSHLQKLWDGIQELPNLKVINFCWSKVLIELPDLSKAPNLECVYLDGCHILSHFPILCMDNLVELSCIGSRLQKLWDGIQELPSLKIVDLSWSEELIELPNLSKAPNLKYLYLSGCDMLCQVPLWPKHNMVELDSTECEESKKISLGSRVSETSLSIEGSEEDDHLDLCGTSLPIKPSFKYYVLPSLQFLSLSYCNSLTELPHNIGLYLPSLKDLRLNGTNVETLPATIKHLSQLKTLDLSWCSRLRCIPELPPSIEYFNATECRSLETLQFTSNSMPLSHKEYQLYLENCVKLDDHKLEAVARHYKLTTQRIISANIKDSSAELVFPGSKVPECLSSYRAQDSLFPLELPLHSKAMGFIFYSVVSRMKRDVFGIKIKCRIELRNVPKVHFMSWEPYQIFSWEPISDHVLLWYHDSSSHMMTKEVSRMKASAATDDLCAWVWFELDCPGVKEWGVCPIFIDDTNCARDFPSFL